MNTNEISDIQRKYRDRTNFIYLEVGFYYLLIFSCIYCVSFLMNNLSLGVLISACVVSIGVIGWSQFSLSNALHEGVHKNFGKKHNEFLARILTAYPIGFTMKSVRVPHWDHHRYFGIEGKDPDFPFYSSFPQTKVMFIQRLLYNISGVSAIKQFYNQVFHQAGELTEKASESQKKDFEFMYLVLVQLIILTLFILLFLNFGIIVGVLSYVALWIFPLATVAKFCSSTRLLCEHGSPDNTLVFRTITGSLFQTNQLGAFRFNYHAEHHIIPSIPYHRLSDAKDDIKGQIPDDSISYESFSGGYLRLIIKWFFEMPFK